MPYYFIVDNATLEDVFWYQGEEPQQWGGPWGDPSKFTQVQLDPKLDHRTVSAARDEAGHIVMVTNEGKKQEMMMEMWADVKEKRNAMLRDCDWTICNDSPLDANKQAEWRAYRQALRDLPLKFADPRQVVYPVPPN
jgi:hypothetical protein